MIHLFFFLFFVVVVPAAFVGVVVFVVFVFIVLLLVVRGVQKCFLVALLLFYLLLVVRGIQKCFLVALLCCCFGSGGVLCEGTGLVLRGGAVSDIIIMDDFLNLSEHDVDAYAQHDTPTATISQEVSRESPNPKA